MNPELNKEALRAYLLGILPSAGQTELEERLFSDSDLYQELILAEDELVDQYVAGELTSEEKQQFESHFLITVERQRKLRFGKIFRRYLNSGNASDAEFLRDPQSTEADPQLPVTPASPSFLQSLFRRTPLRLFLVSLLLVVGVAALYRAVVRKDAKNEARQTMILTLSPGATKARGALQHLASPPSDTNIKLQLEVIPGKFRNYNAALVSQDETVSTGQEITTEMCDGQSIVPFVVPGEVLKPGDYEVKLSGTSESGEVEDIDNYSFRVIGP